MGTSGSYGFIGVIILLLFLSFPFLVLLISDYTYNKKRRKVKTFLIKYDTYIVGEPSGEIFYVDKKRINKLKKYNLIAWSNEIGRYLFKDDKVEEIKKTISPMILNYFSDNVIKETDLIDRTPF